MLNKSLGSDAYVSHKSTGVGFPVYQALKQKMRSFEHNKISPVWLVIYIFTVTGCAGVEVESKPDHKYASHSESASSYNQGIAAYRAQDSDVALQYFRAVLTSSTEVRICTSTRYNIGMILLEKGEMEGARSAFLEVLTRSPTHLGSLINLGLVLIKTRQYQAAIEHYRQALMKYPYDLDIMKNLLIAFRLDKKYALAEALGRKLLRKRPDDPKILQNLGLVYLDSGKLAMAELIFLRSLEKLGSIEMNEPDIEPHAGGYNNLGVIYMRMNMADKALSNFKKALEIDPNHIDTLVNMGTFFHKFRNYPKAVEAFKRVLDQKPDYLRAIKGIGYAYYGSGRPEEARDYILKAIQKRPDDAKCYFIMGEIYSRLLHDKAQAIEFYLQYKNKMGPYIKPDDPVHSRLRLTK